MHTRKSTSYNGIPSRDGWTVGGKVGNKCFIGMLYCADQLYRDFSCERYSIMFVKMLNILIAECIKIPAEGLNPQLERKIHERLVFTNPDYELRHNRGEWIGSIPPQISCLRQKGRSYILPRGFLDQLLELCKKFQQPYRLVDRRRYFDPLPFEFHGELKSYQQDAAEAVLERDFATLAGGHKSGKTVIALYTIAQRRQPALILIPKLELLEGWLAKIENFLQIPSSEVGIFSTGEHRVGKRITIAHTGEVMRHWKKIADQVGYLIVDECQRCPPKVITHLIPNFDTRYMLGLSSTVQRNKDRLSRIIYFYIGDVVYAINEKDAREGRGIIHAHIVARPTEFEYPYRSRADYVPMLHTMMQDKDRIRIIADDIETELKKATRALLVLSAGEEYDRILRQELSQRDIPIHVYEQKSDALREEADGNSNNGSKHCEISLPSGPSAVFVTPQVLAECSAQLHSNVLFLTVPIYFRKALANAIRDLHSNGNGEGGKLKIYDYVDQRIGLLENYFRMRSYNYGVHPEVLLNPNLN